MSISEPGPERDYAEECSAQFDRSLSEKEQREADLLKSELMGRLNQIKAKDIARKQQEGPLPQSTDAKLWAREFNETAIRLGYQEMGEDWLAVWFANAICAGADAEKTTLIRQVNILRDAIHRHINQHINQLETSNGKFSANQARITRDELYLAVAEK